MSNDEDGQETCNSSSSHCHTGNKAIIRLEHTVADLTTLVATLSQ